VAQRSPALAGDEAFVRGLYQRTDGVPLFVASIMSEVTARAAADGEDHSALALPSNVAVPENLTAIIDHYIARLGGEQRTLLSAAAVCGIEFRVGTIARALERDAAGIGPLCEELAREQLWLTPPRAWEGSDTQERPYSFRHSLFRQVLYERTAATARASLHCKVGAALQGERAAGVAVTAAELAMHFDRGREPMTAVSYYAEAADAALKHLSSAECVSLAEQGLSLLHNVPEGAERNTFEIALATLHGVGATHVLGVNLEAKRAFQRAYALLSEVPQHPMRIRLLHGFGFLLWLRADYAEALAVAQQAETLASGTNDPVLVLAARIMQGEVYMLQGRPGTARTCIQRGLALIEPLERPLAETLVPDAQVTLGGLLGVQLLHLGDVEHARQHLEHAYARACELGQPMARTVAIWLNALCAVREGDAPRVAALADEMQTLVDEFSLAHTRTACRWFRGWADARMGRPLEGFRRIREAYDENVRLGMLAGGSETLGYAAEALLLAGEPDAAQHQLEEALEIVNVHGERVYLPHLFLIQAAIARARGEMSAAHASVRQAVAEARAQEARWLELIALVELCECHGAKTEDRHALASVVQRLRGASDTTVVRKAQALLENAKDSAVAAESLSARRSPANWSVNAGAG
jgi:tetratricopeptide (TPR) repeat protein